MSDTGLVELGGGRQYDPRTGRSMSDLGGLNGYSPFGNNTAENDSKIDWSQMEGPKIRTKEIRIKVSDQNKGVSLRWRTLTPLTPQQVLPYPLYPVFVGRSSYSGQRWISWTDPEFVFHIANRSPFVLMLRYPLLLSRKHARPPNEGLP